jgi:hypothetical protein
LAVGADERKAHLAAVVDVVDTHGDFVTEVQHVFDSRDALAVAQF